MQIFIETERLIIRELLPSDLEGMFELDSDPEVHRFLGNKPSASRDESMQMINSIRQQYADHGIGRWAMTEKTSGEFVGWTGFKYMTELTNGHIHYYDIGYRLVKRFWGKGYASESAKASLDYGFENFNTDVIYAMAHLENHVSLHVLQKTGLKCIETFEYKDLPCQWLRIMREEWASKLL